ncbi:hypothetical protein BRCON_1488 [Candidatus Sumerlaea chitinivorans]|uniref:Uncharacterized protein n=1 Tax=Sumerlaea chitinivorans TaxID=2250252 RepID=A0A2Z4Y794_SUMC1|nr:hypothetical protein BRCON_1488 [Candidatus Sumerlaea chitinivorans]
MKRSERNALSRCKAIEGICPWGNCIIETLESAHIMSLN